MLAVEVLIGFGLICWTAASVYIGIKIGRHLAKH